MLVKNSKKWSYVKISEICDFKGGGTPSKQEPTYWSGKINWASVKDIKGDFLESTKEFITPLGLKNSAASLAKPGDVILITRISPGKTILSKIETAINQDLKIIIPKVKTHPKFLHYYFQSIHKKIIDLSSGTTVLGITLNSLNEIEIPRLSFGEQHAIVSKIEELFSELDKGVESLKLAQQQLKVYRQSVLKWAFEGKNLKSAQLLKLNDVCGEDKIISYGVIKLGDKIVDGVPCLRTSDVRFLAIDTVGVKKISKELSQNYKRTILTGGEVLVNIRGTLGGVAVVPKALNGWNVSREIAVVPIKSDVNPQFIAYQIASLKSQNWLNGVTKGIAYSGINLHDLRNLPIILPSQKEQTQLVKEIEFIFSLIAKMEESINESLQQSEALRQSILKRAFEGKLLHI